MRTDVSSVQQEVECLPTEDWKNRGGMKTESNGITTVLEEWWDMQMTTQGRCADDVFNIWFWYFTNA